MIDIHSILIFACILFIFILQNNFDSKYKALSLQIQDLEVQVHVMRNRQTSDQLYFENMELKYELDVEKNKTVKQPLTEKEIDIMKG